MGKNLKGKESGKGLYRRKDGRYEARIFVHGTGKHFQFSISPEIAGIILEFLFQSGMKNGCFFMWCIL